MYITYYTIFYFLKLNTVFLTLKQFKDSKRKINC